MFNSKLKIDIAIKISPEKLIEGGADIFKTQAKNQPSVVEGLIVIIPLVTCVFREFVLLYIVFIVKKRQAEHKPCASIIKIALLTPSLEQVTIAANTKLICATEDNAIITFKSVCRVHIILIVSPPNKPRLINFVFQLVSL